MVLSTIVAGVLVLPFFGQAAVQRVAYDYSALYDRLNPSIVKVHADSGTGSGFVVHESGLIATNHHVVRNVRYVAVEFADGRKVTADIVLLNPRDDLALLRVNRSVIAAVRPLPLLAADADSSIRPGMPVVAFGSPLSQTFLMTQGIVSKVERAVLLGDFLIQHGNSGGPLVDLDGRVIGINTFGEGGVSGAVRVNVLRDALTSALERAALTEPPAELLPVPDKDRYPTAVLKEKVRSEPMDIAAYRLDGGKFTVTAITPVLLGKAQVQTDLQQAANRYNRRGKKIKDEKFDPVDEPFYDWYRNATSTLDAVVTFEVKPDFGQTTGSMWGTALSAIAAGAARRPMDPTHQTYEYKSEFQEMKLFKDGQLVTPITPGRTITEQSLSNGLQTFVDEAYSGWYVYHPAVFSSGKMFRIDIYDAREPGRVHKSIALPESSRLIQQLRRDFAGVLKASGS